MQHRDHAVLEGSSWGTVIVSAVCEAIPDRKRDCFGAKHAPLNDEVAATGRNAVVTGDARAQNGRLIFASI